MPKKQSKIKTKRPNWDSVGMSPRAQEQYKRYIRSIQDDIVEIEETSLVVLIWGPGPSGADLHDKRIQIRGMLRERGDVALFSEELDMVCRDFKASARAKELVQANRADFIVVLYSSPGSIAEVHDFAHFTQQLGSKMLVFIDSRHRL